MKKSRIWSKFKAPKKAFEILMKETHMKQKIISTADQIPTFRYLSIVQM